MEKRRKIVGVLGGATCNENIYNKAFEIGKLIAKENYILICGGRSGVMEAAAKGAKSENGLTIGILPTNSPGDANPYIDIPVVTGIGEARNVIIVKTADILIAINGAYGTLSEIAFGSKLGKKIIGIETWDVPGIMNADTPEDAIDLVNKILRS